MKTRRIFKFFETEQQAKEFCDEQNAKTTTYMRKHHPATFTEWYSRNGVQDGFVCWYNE